MSAGRFKDINDCMNQMTAKYPDPNIRKQVCLRLMGETNAASSNANNKPKPKANPFPFQKGK